MKVSAIIATASEIKIQLSGLSADTTAVAKAFVPLLCGNSKENKTPGRLIFESNTTQKDGFVLPRYIGGYDLSICRFEVTFGGETVGGVRYVTDFGEGFSKNDFSFTVKKPVGTWINSTEEDMDLLGFGCMMNELNCAWIQTVSPKEDDIPHEWNGKTYYFDREFMELYDSLMLPCVNRRIPCLIRLINRFSYRLCGSDNELVKIIGHPDYEPTGFNEQMSAFNLRTEEGLDMY
ncbi:MAG: hypothetical protein IJY39_06060 [Clostridia bacterium]|nr:hypothetical protein [Clostridia bacterium]